MQTRQHSRTRRHDKVLHLQTGNHSLVRLSSRPNGNTQIKKKHIHRHQYQLACRTPIRRLHRRLRNGKALVQLHLTPYHVTPKPLRRRTSNIAVPADMCVQAVEICKDCKGCATSRPAPIRARISGWRGEGFGDVHAIDHAERNAMEPYTMYYLMLDASLYSLFADLQSTRETHDTLDTLQMWIHSMT